MGTNPIASERSRVQSFAGTMDSHDDLTTHILNSLNSLPREDQVQVILAVISAALKNLTVYRILEVRVEIAMELDPNLPLVRAALELIDGQMALREIAGDEAWR